MPSLPELELSLLGRARVRFKAQDLTAEVGAKALGLMAFLAMTAPTPIARDKVAGTFWADKSEEASRYRLRHTLWDLRRVLGKTHLQADEEQCWLVIDASITIDLTTFQTGCRELKIDTHQYQPRTSDLARLRQLVDLYRGEFLSHLTVRDAPLFEEWVLAERERLSLLFQELLWSLARAQQLAEDWTGAVQTLMRLIEVDPLRERNYRALMGVHLRIGDRGAALQVYKQCASKLASELGVAPSPGTEQLRDTIARQSPESTAALLQRVDQLVREKKYEQALAAATAAEGFALDPVTGSQLALLRAEIALSMGKRADSLSLIQSARQSLAKMFAQ